MGEIWRDVPGVPGILVSSGGRIMSHDLMADNQPSEFGIRKMAASSSTFVE